MKYEFKGTKGRWVASANFDGNPCVELIESGWQVGQTFIVEELGQFSPADANLIAAAPDLLNACIKVLELREKALNTEDLFPVLRAIENDIKPAIHKALNIQP